MLPLLPFERIAKKTGAKRVSKDALEELRDIMEEYAMEIAEKEVRLSRHANRRTVKPEDVSFIVKKI
jgi:DNA-binding protein